MNMNPVQSNIFSSKLTDIQKIKIMGIRSLDFQSFNIPGNKYTFDRPDIENCVYFRITLPQYI